MKAIHLKALRDLWLMRGQALAIALVIASGIAMLVMSQATLDSLRDTRARLYQDYRFADLWAGLKRAPESVAARIAETPGIAEVQTRVLAAAKLEVAGFDEPVEATGVSRPDAGAPPLNRLYLRAGRMPARTIASTASLLPARICTSGGVAPCASCVSRSATNQRGNR